MSIGECDCCGKWSKTISRIWYLGYMETYACAECRQDDEEEESETEENSYPMNSYEIRKFTGIS